MSLEAVIAFNQNNVKTGRSAKGYGNTYFAKRDFERGEEVMRGFGRVIDHQTGHKSVQIGLKKHYLPSKWTGSFWNHSCKPNMYMQTRADGFPSLHALRKIEKGEELNYNYAMSEHAWATGVDEKGIFCGCGTRKGKHKIRAFSELTSRERRDLVEKGHSARYLRNMLA